ncbi:MAG: ABC transporter permease [Candidatus Eisenbacteria bacterium]|uniref:ABC transporter permease n=1 Tax=Eiseniibacteriota bacterium TaxID=2212470 RepID=A0A956SEW0_UNCEI|nr:ABC transporter permease [Candidatus Eisenbacteria bacterium]
MGRRGTLFRENIAMALRNLGAAKMRSSLTILGIVIGVATIIAMVGVISGLGKSIRSQIDSLGTGILYLSKYESGFQTNHERDERRKDFTRDDALAIARLCPSVQRTSAEIKRPGFAELGGKKTSVLGVFGGTETFAETGGWELREGRFLTGYDDSHRADVCVIGAGPAELLFPVGSPLGQWIRVEGRQLQVIGVFEKKGRFLGQSLDDIAVMPLSVAEELYGMRDKVTYIVIQPFGPEYVDEATDEVIELCRRRRGIAAEQENDFDLTSQENLLDLYNQITGVFFLITLIISSIGLLVGGIGVMNMMLVTVRERTREIGIRIAVGARRGDVLGQFLWEAISLSLVGGVLGMLLGYGLAGIVRLASGIPIAVTWPGVLTAIFLSLGVGVFFGIFPAYRASRLDPIDALRYE